MLEIQFICKEMSTLKRDIDQAKNVTQKANGSTSPISIFDKAFDTNQSSKSGYGNTKTSMMAPKMSGEFQAVKVKAKQRGIRSNSTGGEDSERKGVVSNVPSNFDHASGHIHVGGTAINGGILKTDTEARIPRRQTQQLAKNKKSRAKETFEHQPQFKTSFNTDLKSPPSQAKATNSERKHSLQQATSNLITEQHHPASKRLVLMKEKEGSDGKLVVRENFTQADSSVSKLDDSSKAAKLHELSRDNLKLRSQNFPGIRGSSTSALKSITSHIGIRASGSQLKFKKKTKDGSPGSISTIERHSMDQSLNYLGGNVATDSHFTLPQVHQASQMNIHKFEQNELLFEDFNLSVGKIDPLWAGYNRIQFKKGKKHNNISKESLHRHKLRQHLNDEMRLVKKQSDKFHLFSSVENQTTNLTSQDCKAPGGNYTTYDSTAMVSVTSKPSLRLGQTQSVAQFHTQPQLNTTSSQITLKGGETHNMASEAEKRRLKKEQSKLELLEMYATEGKNSGTLTLDQIHTLGQNYVQSLHSIMLNVNEKSSNQSNEMQNFISNFCEGIEFTTNTQTKLQKDEIAQVKKEMDSQESYLKRLENQVLELKNELKLRPYQTNFTDKELDLQIQHFMDLDKQKEETDKIVGQSQYSGAEDELDVLIRRCKVIERMKIANNIRVTFDDTKLITGKDQTVQTMNKIIKDEGNNVMRTITKKVLGNFWRSYQTNDAETQTQDKAIDVLKAQVKQLEKERKEQREEIVHLEQKIENLDTVLLKERTELIRQTARAADFKEKLRMCEEELNEKSDKVGQYLTALDLKQLKIRDQTDEITELQEQLETLTDETREIKNTLKDAEKRLKALDEGGQDVSDEISIPTETKKSFNKPPPQKRAPSATKKKPEPKKEAPKAQKQSQPAIQFKSDPARDARIRQEAMQEAEENAFKKWSKEIEMQDMKLKAQLNMKQEKLNGMNMKLEKQTTLYEKANDEIQRLQTTLGKEQESKQALKKQLTVIQEDMGKMKTQSARRPSKQQPQAAPVREPSNKASENISHAFSQSARSASEKAKMENSQHSIVTSEMISAMQPKIDSRPGSRSASYDDVLMQSREDVLMNTRDAVIQCDSLGGSSGEIVSARPILQVNQATSYDLTQNNRQTVSIPGLEIHTAKSPSFQKNRSPQTLTLAKQNTVSPPSASLTQQEMSYRRPIMPSSKSTIQRQPVVKTLSPAALFKVKAGRRKSSMGTQVDKVVLAKENPSTLYDGKSNSTPQAELPSAKLPEVVVEMSDNVNTINGTQQISFESSSRNPLLNEEEYQKQQTIQMKLSTQSRSNSNGGQFRANTQMRQIVQRPFVMHEQQSPPPAFDPILTDKTRVRRNTWKGIKFEAMKPGHELTNMFQNYSHEEQKLIKMLIEAQTNQGDMETLVSQNTPFRSPSPLLQKFEHSPQPELQTIIPPTLSIRTSQQNKITRVIPLNKDLDDQMDTYNEMIAKAYSGENQKVLLEKAKQSLDATELKLLILMLQMRGQFDARGGPMVPKSTQTMNRQIQAEINVTRRNTYENGTQTRILGQVFEDEFFRRMTGDKPNMASVSCQASDTTIKNEKDKSLALENTRRVLLGNPRGDHYFNTDGTLNSAISRHPSSSMVLLGSILETEADTRNKFLVDSKKHVNFNSKARNQLGKGHPRSLQKRQYMNANSDFDASERSDVNSDALVQHALTSLNAAEDNMHIISEGEINQQLYSHAVVPSLSNQRHSIQEHGLHYETLQLVREDSSDMNLHRYSGPDKIFYGMQKLQSDPIDISKNLSMANQGRQSSLGTFKREIATEAMAYEHSSPTYMQHQPGFDEEHGYK